MFAKHEHHQTKNFILEVQKQIKVYWMLSCNVLKKPFPIYLKVFHWADNRNNRNLANPREPSYVPSAKIQPLLVHANRVFRNHYIPHQQLTVVERFAGTKKHISLMQYLPNKHYHPWEVKFWILCNSMSHYCLFFDHHGAKSDEDKTEIQ